MAAHLADAVTERTCGICLEDPKNPLDLPCGHSFCDGCLGKWRSRYGVEEEMRRKCPICRARIPPSKEMVGLLRTLRARKQQLEDANDTSSEDYHQVCYFLAKTEKELGADWDGVTVLQDNNDKPPVVIPNYIGKAVGTGDIKPVLKWINANRTEDRANAVSSAEMARMPVLCIACMDDQLAMTTQLLQLGANVDGRASYGGTATSFVFNDGLLSRNATEMVRLLLSWGASFFPEEERKKEHFIQQARKYGKRVLADLLESELGGRRCEIVNLLARPELNGKTCVTDEYLPGGNQYKVTLENKSKEVLVLGPDNLKRRDRTPQDSLNRDESQQPVVTEETEARAEQAAAELLAELGLDESPRLNVPNKSKKKKKGGKKKK
ncbi:hypothetical protein THAOC_30855 [Thalassiosira oceanica]|uniref:RING-type domain-containing protein n=1 Tax=Thalassiosira oceanica TaxID=159749 RepID=K0RAL2_THAOC|nr:hypothetical protein THAOC_30855 [Thalassiosira oceanica]|eukprot:EJK50205.1 hypothetical protein THAOC_30855 [Thalassiosira oceanica]